MVNPNTEVIGTDGFWGRIRIIVKGQSPEALKRLVESLKEEKEDGEVVPFTRKTPGSDSRGFVFTD